MLSCYFTAIPSISDGCFCCLIIFEEQSIGSLQKKYCVGSFELLSKTAPIQALSLLVLGPVIDYFLTGKLLSNYKLSSGAFVSTFFKSL